MGDFRGAVSVKIPTKTLLLMAGLMIALGPAATTSCQNRAPTESRCSKAELHKELRKIEKELQRERQKQAQEQVQRAQEEKRRRELGCSRAFLNCP